ncbi:MAG: hypothetical protein ACYS74_17660, partial [Planctomycetota bacterium]
IFIKNTQSPQSGLALAFENRPNILGAVCHVTPETSASIIFDPLSPVFAEQGHQRLRPTFRWYGAQQTAPAIVKCENRQGY